MLYFGQKVCLCWIQITCSEHDKHEVKLNTYVQELDQSETGPVKSGDSCVSLNSSSPHFETRRQWWFINNPNNDLSKINLGWLLKALLPGAHRKTLVLSEETRCVSNWKSGTSTSDLRRQQTVSIRSRNFLETLAALMFLKLNNFNLL